MFTTLPLLIVIPGHTHTNLAVAVQTALTTGYDILVVDAGTTEHSLESIADLECHILHVPNNKGRGATLIAGAQYAATQGYSSIISLDTDDYEAVAYAHLLAAEAENSPEPCLIIGFRQSLRQKGNGNCTTPARTSINFGVRLACGLEIEDANTSFRLYPIKELLAQDLRQQHCGFELESLVKFAWSGIAVRTISLPPLKTAKAKESGRLEHFCRTLCLLYVHGWLIFRRLLPWPYKRLTQQEPLPQRVYKTVSGNPLKVLGRICREHTSPFWLAIAVWLGIFMGALPLLAVHTIAIIYVAHRLHLNKVAAVAASQFCMPPVVPVLCIQTGYYLRKGELLIDFSWQPWLLGIHERLWEWFIGSLLLGPLLGTIGGVIMYWTAKRLQKKV
jgi:uncharacterized protein (DUF2062 family)